MSRSLQGLVAALLTVPLLGCSNAAEDGDEPEPEHYLPIVSDFQGYREWTSFAVDDAPGDGVVHLTGPRRVYINRLPAVGATEFPVGTLIVKELEVGAIPERKVFAMAKRERDASYNATGAEGWEWWELVNTDELHVDKVWSGVGPPAGEMYGGDPNASCNSCHASAAENDFVHSSPLALDELSGGL